MEPACEDALIQVTSCYLDALIQMTSCYLDALIQIDNVILKDTLIQLIPIFGLH